MKIEKEHIIDYISTIVVEYGNKLNDEQFAIRVELWYNALQEYPKELVDNAVWNAIKSCKFPPKLADIVEQIERIKSTKEEQPEELWAIIREALPFVRYNADGYKYNMIEENGKSQGENCMEKNGTIWESLPTPCKLYLRNIGELIELSYMTSEQIMYEKARFLKRVVDLKKQEELKVSLGDKMDELFGDIEKLMIK